MIWFEYRMMGLCIALFVGAIVYGTVFDQRVLDWVSWVTREHHYANGVVINCDAYECMTASWKLDAEKPRTPAQITLSFGGQRFDKGYLSDTNALIADGWSDAFGSGGPRQAFIREWTIDGAIIRVWVEFWEGSLSSVSMSGPVPKTLSVDGEKYALPIDPRRVASAFGEPTRTKRRNAVNGYMD